MQPRPAASQTGKGQEPMGHGASAGRAAFSHLGFSSVKLISDSGLWKCERVHFCCFSRTFVIICYSSPRRLLQCSPEDQSQSPLLPGGCVPALGQTWPTRSKTGNQRQRGLCWYSSLCHSAGDFWWWILSSVMIRSGKISNSSDHPTILIGIMCVCVGTVKPRTWGKKVA